MLESLDQYIDTLFYGSYYKKTSAPPLYFIPGFAADLNMYVSTIVLSHILHVVPRIGEPTLYKYNANIFSVSCTKKEGRSV